MSKTAEQEQEALELLQSIVEPPSMVAEFNVEKGQLVERPPMPEELEAFRADSERVISELVEWRDAVQEAEEKKDKLRTKLRELGLDPEEVQSLMR